MKKMLILLLCLTLSGCATASSQLCTVSINSLSNGESVVAKKCIILSGSKDVNTDDLQFKEYAMYVKRALEDKGYKIIKTYK